MTEGMHETSTSAQPCGPI